MKKQLLALAILAVSSSANAAALNSGDIAFTSFNADEDGLSFVALVDIAANTSIFFTDNEWTGSAFNTGESYNQWVSGASTIDAGSVIRLSGYDKTTLAASIGTLSRVSVTGSSNWGLANSNETVYAYQAVSANSAPSSFLAAITNGSFTADGSLSNTGLSEGVNAIRLNANATSTSPDYAEYNGVRSDLASFNDYKPLLSNPSNWIVDSTNGTYTTTVPNTTSFTVAAAVPEPETYAMMLAGLGLMGFVARRKAG